MMEEKKYQIFISSTFKDLFKTRKDVIDNVLNMYHFPVGMEFFSAANDDQWEVIKRTIDTSDYYVLILGFKYGSVSTDGISYTEKEYNYAKEKGIPILSFIRDEKVATTIEEREVDINLQQKIMEFRAKASQNRIVDFWINQNDLINKVTTALYKSFSTHPRIGWVRGDKAIDQNIIQEMIRLNKENKELKLQIDLHNTKKNPKLALIINDIESENEPISLEFREQINNKLLIRPSEININEILDKDSEKIQKANEFNRQLPTFEVIDKYNEELKFYQLIKNNGQIFNFEIQNNGSSKANDILIFINFPKEFKIFEKQEFEQLEKPKKPVIPRNPFKETKVTIDSVSNLYSKMHFNFNTSENQGLYSLRNYLKYPEGTYIFVTPEDNQVQFKCKQLLHTLREEFADEVVVVPLETGIFEIEISILCEEYAENHKYKTRIEVK